MKDYLITTQAGLRKAFWEMCDECDNPNCTCRKIRSKFNLDANMCFSDFKDGLAKDGMIPWRLEFRARLFK